MASFLRAAAHPVRLEVLASLVEGPCCVRDLNELVSHSKASLSQPVLSQPMLSQHMATLRKAGLVANHARGNLRCYYLPRPHFVKALLEALRAADPYVEREREEVLREMDADPA